MRQPAGNEGQRRKRQVGSGAAKTHLWGGRGSTGVEH